MLATVQLDWKLRQDGRIKTIERTNIRYMPLEMISKAIDLVTIDVSFISLRIVVPVVLKFLKKKATILSLIKPQFEQVKIRSAKEALSVIHPFMMKSYKISRDFFSQSGLIANPVIPSPISGAKGNKEFFISMTYEG